MNGTWRGFVCGFGDLNAGVGGVAWDLGEPGAMLLTDGKARPASFAIEEGGDAATLELSAEGAEVEATLTPEAAPVALAGPVESLGVVDCKAEVRPAGAAKTVRCQGQIARWSGDVVAGAATFRYLTVEKGDELLIVTATGSPDAPGHGEDRTAGWRLQGEDATPFEETLISTQYDGRDRPTRIGVELWPEDANQSSRAAATRVAGSALGGVNTGGTWSGLFRCHADGTEGLGIYLLRRG